MQSRESFIKGPVKTPWPLRGDAYTVSSDRIVSSEAKRVSVYNFTNRKSPVDGFPKGVAKDGRMCLYGVTDFIQRELTTPVTELDIAMSKAFMSDAHSLGGPLDFDEDMWLRVVREYGGYPPIRIDALPEGSTFWMNEPAVQVTSLGEGFGEIAAIVEAVMVGYVANATARLTLTRHLLERIRDVVRKHHPTYTPNQVDGIAQWMIHDFGMRASSTPQESEIYGRTHLLCFNGTDTFNAAFQAWANNAKRPIGTSILALAHRIVMGYVHEDDAYKALLAATHESMGSYVADCYDFHSSVRKFLTAMAKKGESKVVARPDSGDYLENVMFVVEQAVQHDLYKMNEEGRAVSTNLSFIQGDSMSWEKIQKIFIALERKDMDPTGWGIFGIGGWLRNTPNRDSLSSAYKLSAFGRQLTPTVKLSDTFAKVSIPGPNMVVRPCGGEDLNSPTVFFTSEVGHLSEYGVIQDAGICPAYQTFYNGLHGDSASFGKACLEDFNDHRDRVIGEFDAFSYVDANRGTHENTTLSRKILKFQHDTMQKYGKSVSDYAY